MNGPRYWNGKRWVGGGAAWTHIISANGGWETHHAKVCEETIHKWVQDGMPGLEILQAPEQKKRLRLAK